MADSISIHPNLSTTFDLAGDSSHSKRCGSRNNEEKVKKSPLTRFPLTEASAREVQRSSSSRYTSDHRSTMTGTGATSRRKSSTTTTTLTRFSSIARSVRDKVRKSRHEAEAEEEDRRQTLALMQVTSGPEISAAVLLDTTAEQARPYLREQQRQRRQARTAEAEVTPYLIPVTVLERGEVTGKRDEGEGKVYELGNKRVTQLEDFLYHEPPPSPAPPLPLRSDRRPIYPSTATAPAYGHHQPQQGRRENGNIGPQQWRSRTAGADVNKPLPASPGQDSVRRWLWVGEGEGGEDEERRASRARYTEQFRDSRGPEEQKCPVRDSWFEGKGRGKKYGSRPKDAVRSAPAPKPESQTEEEYNNPYAPPPLLGTSLADMMRDFRNSDPDQSPESYRAGDGEESEYIIDTYTHPGHSSWYVQNEKTSWHAQRQRADSAQDLVIAEVSALNERINMALRMGYPVRMQSPREDAFFSQPT